MSGFQKPTLTDNDVVDVIQKLYGESDDNIKNITNLALQSINDQKTRRLAGEFGEEAKKYPTKDGLLAETTAFLGNEFLLARKDDNLEFDPYAFMKVKNTSLKPA